MSFGNTAHTDIFAYHWGTGITTHLSNLYPYQPVRIVVDDQTRSRLTDTCFRPGLQCAGNFMEWHNPDELLTETLIVDDLLNAATSCPAGNHRISIEMDRDIGWDGTIPLADIDPRELEHYAPNRKSKGLRVLPDSTMRAPRTNVLTMSIRVHKTRGYGILIRIFTIYPGVNIGKLEGNITQKTGRVFFDWSHPGA